MAAELRTGTLSTCSLMASVLGARRQGLWWVNGHSVGLDHRTYIVAMVVDAHGETGGDPAEEDLAEEVSVKCHCGHTPDTR